MSETNKKPIERFHPDKFPGLLESPGSYRKGSDDFGVTFAVPRGMIEHVQPLQHKAGRPFVIYCVEVGTPEQAEQLLNVDVDPAVDGLSRLNGSNGLHGSHNNTVPVDVLAAALGMTDRNVQILADQGLIIRVQGVRGQYDVLATCAALYKAFRGAENGATDAYSDERTKAMRLKRQERELTLLERVKRLTDAEATVRAFTKLLALINSKLNMMPKTLSLSVEMVSAVEAETVLDDWKRRLQSELSSHDVAKLVTQEASVDVGERAAQPGKKNKGKKKK